MPTPKQMEKLAAEAHRHLELPAGAPEEPLPPEYWQSLLQDPRALSNGLQTRQRSQPSQGHNLQEMPISSVFACDPRCGLVGHSGLRSTPHTATEHDRSATSRRWRSTLKSSPL
jgi:hypothetical protein